MTLGLKKLLQSYSRLFIFAAGLLLGIQVPSFVDQYQKRVDAHFLEVSANISGFQNTANLLFDGDIDALIAYYESSSDAVFQSDANSIRLIVNRFNRISAEQAAMQNNIVAVAAHVMFAADQEFFDEAVEQYSYTVPLNSIAIQWGLALAIFITLTIDLVLFACVKCLGMVGRRRPRHSA